MLTVRSLLREDIELIDDVALPNEWCTMEPVGYTALRDGEIAAIGQITWDRHGRAWAWLNRFGSVPAVTLHRAAIDMLAMLREVGEPRLYMICNLAIPNAEKWVRRLGFVRDDSLPHSAGPVYRCDLK